MFAINPRTVFFASCLMLGGCVSHRQEPREYSPGYSYVATNDGSEKSVTASVLAPDSCLADPVDATRPDAATDLTVVSDLGAHLPPGCANAYNLQRMVEKESDLVEGRRMGPASAAPTARAARRYLNGDNSASNNASQIPLDHNATTTQ